MPISKNIEINGFTFTFDNFNMYPQLSLPIYDVEIPLAIADRDPAVLDALDQIFRGADEIYSVLCIAESLFHWKQSPHADNLERGLQTLIQSQYAPPGIKVLARTELAKLTPKDP